MVTRFIFDVEATNLYGEGFAYGYVVVKMCDKNHTIDLLETGECYSIEGAQSNEVNDFVKTNVVPKLDLLGPFLNHKIGPTTLPKEIVITTRELRDKFYQVYKKWKDLGAEFFSDVNFPVETNFLNAVAKDDIRNRYWMMPYPLKDIANFVDVKIDRVTYSGLTNLREHNPLDDALASAYALHKQFYNVHKKNMGNILLRQLNHLFFKPGPKTLEEALAVRLNYDPELIHHAIHDKKGWRQCIDPKWRAELDNRVNKNNQFNECEAQNLLEDVKFHYLP